MEIKLATGLLEGFKNNSAEDIIYALYCYAETQASMVTEEAEKWKYIANALGKTCEMLDEYQDDDSYCLVY